MTLVEAVAAPESEASAPSLGEEISSLLGDTYSPGSSSSGESPESDPASAAGTTPAEPTPETAGQPTDAGTVQPDAGEAQLGTTPTPAPTAAEDDPFKDTTPLTFTVNGQPVTNEDIRVFKEGGAVIRPEAVQSISQKLAERESLQERNHRQSQEYQTLAKVTEWSGQDGKTIGGVEGAIENRVANAVLFAENQLLISTLSDDEKLAQLLTTKQVPDGRGGIREVVTLNPAALKALQRENTLQQREVTAAIRDHFRGLIAQASQPQAQPVNYQTEAPRLVGEIAKQANLDASLLTTEDKALLAEHLPANTDKQGTVSVAWQNLAKRMMTDRAAQKANLQRTVTTTAAATKTGLANMAAAARGVRQPVQPATKTTTTRAPTPKQERAANEGQLFDQMQRAGSRALRSQR